MKKYFYYKITSPIGKVYIGKTTNFSKRMYKHKNEYLVKNKKNYTDIEMSFLEYGFDSHLIEKLNICICNEDFSDYLEEHYIRLYCSFSKWSKNGLNKTTGGTKNIKQIDAKIKLKVYSESERKKMSNRINSLRKTNNYIEKLNKGIELAKTNGVYKKNAENRSLNCQKYISLLDGQKYTIKEISDKEKKVDSGIGYHFKKYGHYKNIYFKELA